MMRNVFCHEQSFEFASLKEFSEYVEMYFGSRDEFAAMIELYKAKCRGNLQSIDKYFYKKRDFLFIIKMKILLRFN